jgi:plasmid stabilization system protein ParE
MSLPIILRPIARLELDEAMLGIRRQKPSPELEFKVSVDEMLTRIAAHPLRFHLSRGPARCALLRRFPDAIHFLPEKDAIIVLAIFDTRRDPHLLEGRC